MIEKVIDMMRTRSKNVIKDFESILNFLHLLIRELMEGFKTDQQIIGTVIKVIMFLIIGNNKEQILKAFILLYTSSIFPQLPGVHAKCLLRYRISVIQF